MMSDEERHLMLISRLISKFNLYTDKMNHIKAVLSSHYYLSGRQDLVNRLDPRVIIRRLIRYINRVCIKLNAWKPSREVC